LTKNAKRINQIVLFHQNKVNNCLAFPGQNGLRSAGPKTAPRLRLEISLIRHLVTQYRLGLLRARYKVAVKRFHEDFKRS